MNLSLSQSKGLLVLPTIDSTQDEIARRIRRGDFSVPALLALEQTKGRGRHGRQWYSPRGECLALSIAFLQHANCPRPELLGMAVAVATARALKCGVMWPNDIVLGSRKVGGVLGEVVACVLGRVPVIGVGANLNMRFLPPHIAKFATSIVIEGRCLLEPQEVASMVLRELRALPDPHDFACIARQWLEIDETQGKRYTLPDGRVGVALRVSDAGHLVADVDGTIVKVPSAEAWGVQECGEY